MKEKRIVELSEEHWDFVCRILYDAQVSRRLKGFDSEILNEVLTVFRSASLIIQIY